jgi:hypothetical protein
MALARVRNARRRLNFLQFFLIFCARFNLYFLRILARLHALQLAFFVAGLADLGACFVDHGASCPGRLLLIWTGEKQRLF